MSTEISKRLRKSFDRIQKCGGVVLIHHTSEGGVNYQLPNGRGVTASVISQLREAQLLVPGQDGLFAGQDQTFHTVAA